MKWYQKITLLTISIKCDIYIPLQYNDKTDIDKEKFLVVYEELNRLFGGCSVDDNSLISGRWINPETNESMDDKLRPYQIVCEKNIKNVQLLSNYKEKLKDIFKNIVSNKIFHILLIFIAISLLYNWKQSMHKCLLNLVSVNGL